MSQPTTPTPPPAEKVKPPPPFIITQPQGNRAYLKALIYGPWGAGKTTFASTAIDVAPMGRVLFIDAESGDMSLNGLDLDVIRINKFSQLARVYEFLRLHCRARDTEDTEKLKQLQERFRGPVKPNEKPVIYNTVVVDSLSEVQKYIMYQLLSIDIEHTTLDNAVDTPEFKEWGQSAEMVRLLVRSFRDLPMHVIFVCPEQEAEDNGRIVRRPSLPGKLAGEVQGFVDIVGYLRANTTEDGVVRRLYLRNGPTFAAKHRFRGVDVAYLDSPTMKSLLDLKSQAQS